MTQNATNVLLITVERSDEEFYEKGLEAIQKLEDGESIDQPTTITFPDEKLLAETFNEQTYTLLNVIRDEAPTSIRETARFVGRDKKNVHEELTTLEALGVIRFEQDGRSKRPIFPYADLIIRPFGDSTEDTVTTA
jgi:predicted transcriptional regulator